MQEPIADDYCGHVTVSAVSRNSPLSGRMAVTTDGVVLLTESRQRVTAVTSLTADRHTVLFAGTDDGRIVKVGH